MLHSEYPEISDGVCVSLYGIILISGGVQSNEEKLWIRKSIKYQPKYR